MILWALARRVGVAGGREFDRFTSGNVYTSMLVFVENVPRRHYFARPSLLDFVGVEIGYADSRLTFWPWRTFPASLAPLTRLEYADMARRRVALMADVGRA